jgi:hypothetical protein
MLVKMKCGMSGKEVNHQPGDLVDFPDHIAERLIEDGSAEKVKNKPGRKPKTETASKDEEENMSLG